MVDLGDPAIAEHHVNARFVARVCTDAESSRVAAADDPKTLLWTLFAAKEAAYKVVVKLGNAPGFAHRKFAVSADVSSVRYGDIELALTVDVDDSSERVHVIAATGVAPVSSCVERAAPSEHPSRAVRRLLCAAVAARVPCDAAELEVVRPAVPGSWDGFGPPRMHRAGKALDVDVSLSHDGRFLAYAFS